MKILLHYLKPYKSLIALTMFLAGINVIFSLIDPILFGRMIELAGQEYERHKLGKPWAWSTFAKAVLWILCLSMGTAMISRIAKNFQDYFANVVIQKFGAKIFTDGLKQAIGLPYQEFEDQRSGETLSILTKVRADTERFIQYFLNALFAIVVGIGFVFFYAAIYIHWSVPFAYLVGIGLLTWVTNIFSKKIKTIQKKIVGQTTALAGATTESLRNIELVKSLGLGDQEIDRLNQNTYKILDLEILKVKRIRSISFLQGTMVNTLRQIILFILMWLVFGNLMAPHELVTMQIFSFFIFGPLQEIGNILLSYREAEASIQNYHQLMQKQPEAKPLQAKPLGRLAALRYADVAFKHQSAKHKALQHISFEAHAGETIAFVGPSGSGKTTLVKLLVGLYRPQEGEIFYNNIGSRELSYEELRNQIGLVSQDTQLFSGTIRENLLFVNPSATEAELLHVLSLASCDNLLARAEAGIDSVIGEGGMKVSGGEKQRLSIARALLRHPSLLIFDEATSALDSLTEESITETIRSISANQNQITLMIAHRLSTIMHADKIYVLERGRIIETGTHDSLLNEKGLYYAMWRQQIGEKMWEEES